MKSHLQYAVVESQNEAKKVNSSLKYFKLYDEISHYSNTLQTRGSKLAKFSNWRFRSLLFTLKLAVPFISTQIRNSCYFISPKNHEFGGITVYTFPPFMYLILLIFKNVRFRSKLYLNLSKRFKSLQ